MSKTPMRKQEFGDDQLLISQSFVWLLIYLFVRNEMQFISLELKDHGTTCSCFGESIPYEIIEYCFGI